MVKLFCAVVGAVGSAFEVDIAEDASVSALKKAIKAEKMYQFPADELQLFLAKTADGGWLRSDDPDVTSMRSGAIPEQVKKLLNEEIDPAEEIGDLFGGAPTKKTIHVLVVVLEAGVSGDNDGRSFQKFSVPISFSKARNEGGVPATFRTNRSTTTEALFNLLFPDDDEYFPVIFVRAPPLSGKTAMCDLLYNHIVRSKPDALVSRIRANRMTEDGKFGDFFKLQYGCEFEALCARKCDRVVLIDEAQITYNDEQLWRGYVKDALDSQIPSLRFVLFSSYGSFDAYRKHQRAGTPILIPPQNTFGLNATPSKPGLQLSRVELEEMVRNSIGASVSDLIWILCSGHIGIARAILMFLSCKFGSKTPNAEDLEMELRSVELLHYIRCSYRGIPTADAFQRVKKANDLSEESTLKMSEILNGVASGQIMLVSDGQRTPRSQTAVEYLTKYGFLYEDQAQQLQFASSMHLKIWLHSNRTEPIGYMVSDISHEDFVLACVKRMSASRLQNFATENTSSIARERQIQMELYSATTSCLPRGVLVTPEWRTDDGKGFIDLMIRGSSILWFWELLVNGDDAVNYSKRFETGGKYYGSLTGSSRYVLIDFRQNKGVRHEKHGFLYVSFVDSYTKALVFSLGKSVVSIELSS
ncbi:hypothetical protein P3T76_015559 [Phytophthora citrophthora]|uniref:Crinkler effector protein N-terminal domain-containing protein n=1 Tax=Phytophthora citrophthora TaxID=4793 RepID=A0AAD9FZ34_9STRA|nr:hypothetical protein P3T76_015559 [Phytophthora citrophthora]